MEKKCKRRRRRMMEIKCKNNRWVKYREREGGEETDRESGKRSEGGIEQKEIDSEMIINFVRYRNTKRERRRR